MREKIAFEARFPLEAFKPIALSLGKSKTPRSLKALRDWLLPYFDLFSSGTGREPPRAERIRSWVQLRDAARTLLASVGVGGLWMELTWGVAEAAKDQQFRGTLQRLAQEAEARVQHLSQLGRTGRPARNATFREHTPELIRIYEHITGKEAGRPYWLPDSRAYGGEFYRFSVAVWGCLRDHLPEARNALPTSEGALAEELRNNWPREDTASG
jgi:hypothetical protein